MVYAEASAEVDVESLKYGALKFNLTPRGKRCDKIFVVSFIESFRKDDVYEIIEAPNVLSAAEMALSDDAVFRRVLSGGRVYLIGGDGEVFVIEK